MSRKQVKHLLHVNYMGIADKVKKERNNGKAKRNVNKQSRSTRR